MLLYIPSPITACHIGLFLAEFWTKEGVYTQCMQNTTIGPEEYSWLGFDHTFASAQKLHLNCFPYWTSILAHTWNYINFSCDFVVMFLMTFRGMQ